MREVVRTPEELARYVLGWAEGHIGHLLIRGSPGTGKTSFVREVTDEYDLVKWISGHVTPKQLFNIIDDESWMNTQLMVLDDVDAITQSRTAAQTMKQAMDGTGERIVSYHSSSGGSRDVETEMRFCVITNDDSASNVHLAAVESRALTVVYEPTPQSLVEFAAENGIIQPETKDFILSTGFFKGINLRSLSDIETVKKVGGDWKEFYREGRKQ